MKTMTFHKTTGFSAAILVAASLTAGSALAAGGDDISSDPAHSLAYRFALDEQKAAERTAEEDAAMKAAQNAAKNSRERAELQAYRKDLLRRARQEAAERRKAAKADIARAKETARRDELAKQDQLEQQNQLAEKRLADDARQQAEAARLKKQTAQAAARKTRAAARAAARAEARKQAKKKAAAADKARRRKLAAARAKTKKARLRAEADARLKRQEHLARMQKDRDQELQDLDRKLKRLVEQHKAREDAKEVKAAASKRAETALAKRNTAAAARAKDRARQTRLRAGHNTRQKALADKRLAAARVADRRAAEERLENYRAARPRLEARRRQQEYSARNSINEAMADTERRLSERADDRPHWSPRRAPPPQWSNRYAAGRSPTRRSSDASDHPYAGSRSINRETRGWENIARAPSARDAEPFADARPVAPTFTASNRATVLLVMKPGNKGIRRINKTADPVLCERSGCYISRGPATAARFVSRRGALGARNTLGRRAGACNQRTSCIFRNVNVAHNRILQPVDLRMVRHDRRRAQKVRNPVQCTPAGGLKDCCETYYAKDYVMIVIPEEIAQEAGVTALQNLARQKLIELNSPARLTTAGRSLRYR